jgi:hypothetical protein
LKPSVTSTASKITADRDEHLLQMNARDQSDQWMPNVTARFHATLLPTRSKNSGVGDGREFANPDQTEDAARAHLLLH